MRLIRLRVNQAWVYVLGGVLTDMDGQTLFLHRDDAVRAAARCGLRVAPNGTVSVDEA